MSTIYINQQTVEIKFNWLEQNEQIISNFTIHVTICYTYCGPSWSIRSIYGHIVTPLVKSDVKISAWYCHTGLTLPVL